MKMASFIPKLKPVGVERLKRFHPWLRITDIQGGSQIPKRPSLVPVGGQLWLCSPESFLRLRRIGPESHYPATLPRGTITNSSQAAEFIRPWLSTHLMDTLKRKIIALNIQAENEDLCLRWIFSENDFLPGLILDVFSTYVVAQLNSAPMEWLWPFIKPDIESAYKQTTGLDAEFIEVRNSTVREKEGLAVFAAPTETPELSLKWNGLKWIFHPGGTQKTGSYLDQRDNHRRAAHYAKEYGYKTAWDLCCFEGGFALHLLKHGLKVEAVDQSSRALEILKRNVQLNELENKNITITHQDVFDFLKAHADKAQVDMIVLDPPSFVKSSKELTGALRGYEELNTAALRQLNPGGVLVSCVCSRAVQKNVYQELLQSAAQKANRKIVILEQTGPSADHAPLPAFPEGDYLQAWFLRVD